MDLVLSNLWKYDADSNSWVEMASMLYARTNFALVHLDGYIYAIGGKGQHDHIVGVERYSIEQNIWESKAVCLSNLEEPRTVAVNGRILLYAGVSTSDGHINMYTLEMYNPTTNSWQKMLSETFESPFYERKPTLAVHNGECYRIVWKLAPGVNPSYDNMSSGKIAVSKIKINERGRNHRVTATLQRDEHQVDLKCHKAFCLDGKACVYLSDNTVINTGIDVDDLGPEGLGKKWEFSIHSSESIVPEFTFDILKLRP